MDRAEAEKRILRRGWLAAQAPALQSAVLKKARLVSYPAGDFLFHAGDDPGGIYGVVRGGVGIHVPSFTGEVLLSHVARTGVWFGYGPLMTGQSRTLTFSLLEATEVYHVPLASLEEIERTAPENARAIHYRQVRTGRARWGGRAEANTPKQRCLHPSDRKENRMDRQSG